MSSSTTDRHTTCRPAFPNLPLLLLGCLATAALVLLLAGWGLAFWIAVGVSALLAASVLVQRIGGRDRYRCETRPETKP